MNAGEDYAKAKRQAQANATQTGTNWRMFLYGGVWWVEECQWTDVQGPDIEIIRPEGVEAPGSNQPKV